MDGPSYRTRWKARGRIVSPIRFVCVGLCRFSVVPSFASSLSSFFFSPRSMSTAVSAPPRPAAAASPLPLSLVDRLAAVAWRPPPAHLPGPPPAVLDTGFPFQAACCEICGSICSPLSLQYRDSATVLFRVQQHCRKLVPSVLQQQAECLSLARAAQRGVLDVSDSLSIIDTLNAQVAKSMADVALVSTRAAARAKARRKEAEHEERQREKRRVQQMNASGSLPTTPLRGENSSNSNNGSNASSHRASIALDNTTLSLDARAELDAAASSATSSSSSSVSASSMLSHHPIVSPSAAASLQSFPLPSPVRPSSPSAAARRSTPRAATLPSGANVPGAAAAAAAAHQRTASNAVAAAASRANRSNTGLGLTSPHGSHSGSTVGSLLEDSHDAHVRTTHMGAFALLHSPEEASPLREHAVSEFVP